MHTLQWKEVYTRKVKQKLVARQQHGQHTQARETPADVESSVAQREQDVANVLEMLRDKIKGLQEEEREYNHLLAVVSKSAS